MRSWQKNSSDHQFSFHRFYTDMETIFEQYYRGKLITVLSDGGYFCDIDGDNGEDFPIEESANEALDLAMAFVDAEVE